jgi:PTS system nitrogen regulatory IIA component
MQLTIRDAARCLGVREDLLHRWVKRGELPAVLVNDQYRLNRVELLEWAAAHKMPVSAEILEEPGSTAPAQRIAEAVRTGGIHYALAGTDTASILRSVVAVLPLPADADRELVYQMLLAREKLGSTAAGNGIAIPHPRSPIVAHLERPAVSICFPERPLPFSGAGKPVHTLCVLTSPSVKAHLRLLASLAAVLRDPALPARLEARARPEEILGEIDRVERALARQRAENLARSDRA